MAGGHGYESPTQLISEARQRIQAAPRRPERFDYEYRRNGTINLFVFLYAHRGDRINWIGWRLPRR